MAVKIARNGDLCQNFKIGFLYLPGRLTVGHQVLVLGIGVRIPARQHFDSPLNKGLAQCKPSSTITRGEVS